MSLPQFGSLGKSAKDIFYNNYNLGTFELAIKTRRSTGMEISSSITTELDTKNSFGVLQTKYKVEEYGLTLLQKYYTKNTFFTEISYIDQIVKGSELTFNCFYIPEAGTYTSSLKSSYANDIFAASADMHLSITNPVLTTSAVLGWNGWLGGLETTLDLRNTTIIGNSFALGYIANDFVFHSAFGDGTKFTGSFYQKVDPSLDIGVQVLSSIDTNETLLGIGCKYQLDSKASVCAKLNTRGQLGLAYQQKLHESITLFFSGQYSISEFSAGGQRLGAAINFEF